MKGELIAKVAVQVSVYFGQAYKCSQMNKHLANFDNGKFARILQYHEKYFEAMAWFNLGSHEKQQVDASAQGMGKCVAILRQS